MKASSKPVLPPSVRPDLFGGHFRSFRKNAPVFLTRLSALGTITSFRMGPIQGYFVNDPDLIRDVLVTNAHKFKKGRALQRAKELLGEGLLTSEGEFHLRQRRMIQPAFHRDRIAEYARVMVERAEQASASWHDGEVSDVGQEMMRLTLRIVAQTLFSANVDDEADRIGRSMSDLVALFDYLLLPFSEWLQKLPLPHSRRFGRARDTLNSVIYGIIDERRRSGDDRSDLLSMLLDARDENGSSMSDEQIRDETLTLFLAGHETTANALTWTWYLLSEHPEKAAELHRELDEVLAGRSPAIADIPRLRYAEAVLAESMRLFPPAWAIGRLALESHSLGGYDLRAGSLVLLSPYVTHRDPHYWQEAASFTPERWLDKGVKEVSQTYAYFPFGGGNRRCIGESFAWTEGILLLAAIAQRWRFRLIEGHRVETSAMVTLRPKFGMKMLSERVRSSGCG